MSFLDRIHEANRHDLSRFLPFRVSGSQFGFVRRDYAPRLHAWPTVFQVTETAVTLAPALAAADVAYTTRSAAVEQVLLALRAEGFIHGWRQEPFPVTRHFGDAPSLLIERAAVPLFGVCGYGVHLNGYVREGKDIKMWIARRARDKAVDPGKLDQIVAGGQPHGLGLLENLVKECAEEAAIPAELARQARPVGAVSYCLENSLGLRPDVLFCYDLELPADFVPDNPDGEVEEFYLWPVEQVLESVRDTAEFKFNCSLVVIDFLIRHGVIAPDDPDYLPLIAGLRARERVWVGLT